jgi:hypothetical protein
VRISLAILCSSMLLACSDGDAARDVGELNAGGGGMQPGCIDEFVQEYEEVAEDPPREVPANLCFAGDARPEGPPKFPASSRKVRIEYSRGDYFLTEESASWTFDEPDIARNCIVAKLWKMKLVAMREGKKSESVKIADGKTLRSSETGESYKPGILLGSTISDQTAVPGYRISRETTPFGPACTRAVQEGGFKTSTCSFVQPHTCRSVKVMLPVESRFPNTTGGTQVGRTTEFHTGAVINKSLWVLP